MVSTTTAPAAPSRRLSVNTTTTTPTATTPTAPSNDDESGLTQSLSQMSLLAEGRQQNGQNGAPRLSEASRPLKPSSRRTSCSPGRRMPSRSPSGRDARPTTPTLLRKASMNSLHSSSGHAPGFVPSRRSSVTLTTTMSPKTARSPSIATMPAELQKPPPTAASVAADYFRSEMQIHHGPDAALPTDTIVILHDAVYGHRFSRPRTSRSALSTIVERPERVKAAVLGVSLAYVRLGDRHDDGAFPVRPGANIHDIPKIPFRIRKSTRTVPLTSSAVTSVHGAKWMDELKTMCDTAESKLALGGRELQRPDNVDRDEPAQPLHQGDLYLCAESLDAMEGALGAVCDGVDAVFSPVPAPRRAFVAVRPPGHHCAAAHPSGFCWVNNVLVGIMHGALAHGLTHAAIIDFDLHHGDGSQAIVWQHNARANAATKNFQQWKKTSIGYFSLHDINSYPCEMGDQDKVKNASLCIDNAHGQSVWNVHLQSWKTEHEFWDIYESRYSVILQKTRSYLNEQAKKLRAEGKEPKAAIFLSAGFDASEWESAGMQRHQVNVPTEFYARLSQDVVRLAHEEGLYVAGRVISVLEGGYSDRALFSGVFSHLSGLVSDQSIQKLENGHGLAYGMGQKLGTIAEPAPEPVDVRRPAGPSLHHYDASWWSSQQLDSFESILSKTQPHPPKPRTGTPPTYFSPTQASTAKVIDPVKVRRSLSGLASTIQRPRPASPVTPDVPWTIAAHELSKILIPSDRQTDSCKAEDLNAEATRARRDRQSTLLGIPIPPTPAPQERPTSRMALRERKAKTSNWPADEASERARGAATPSRRSASRSARAKSTEAEQAPAAVAANGCEHRRRSRRLSETAALRSPEKEDPVPVPPLPAGYDQMVNRPPTSSSSRAGSSMSGQSKELAAAPPGPAGGGAATTANLAVKKTRQRGAATPKDGSTPKTPRAPRRTTTPSSKAKTAAKPQPTAQPPCPPLPASEPPLPPVDKITTGVKKIRINLITQSQKGANAVKAEAKAEAEASLYTVPSISDSSLTLAGSDAAQTSPSQAAPFDAGFLSRSAAPGLSTPLDEQPIVDSPSPLEKKSVSGMLSTPTEAASAPVAAARRGQATESPSDPRLFVNYQPEGPVPVALARDDPLQWLPPSVATPSAKTATTTTNTHIKKNSGGGGQGSSADVSHLFRHGSGIRFAPRAASNEGSRGGGESDRHAEEVQQLKQDTKPKPMWEVPETPRRA